MHRGNQARRARNRRASLASSLASSADPAAEVGSLRDLRQQLSDFSGTLEHWSRTEYAEAISSIFQQRASDLLMECFLRHALDAI